jgi:hypothetical protein
MALHSDPLESIDSFNEFLRVLGGIVRLNETDRNPPRYATILESLTRVHLQLQDGHCPIVSNALDQPISENDARRILERLNQVAAIQSEPMAVRAPVRGGMVVKGVCKVSIGGRAGVHGKS